MTPMGASERIPVLVIGGPTAAGKTAAAVAIAADVDGEIVSADSMQIYRGLEIGTAKPTAEERARAVFHLVDIVEATASYSVADYQRDARRAIADIHGRGKLPILCGGTGLYIRAVLGGLSFPPGATPETEAIRRRLTMELTSAGVVRLHERLAAVDPETASRLPRTDARRIIRALEVHEHTGQPFSALARVDDGAAVAYNAATFVLTCPRPLLYERIESRVDAMMDAGWLQEVVELRLKSITHDHQCMQAIGYRHLMGHLETGEELSETVARIKRDTRRFAKRQLTWFRRETGEVLEWGGALSFEAATSALRISGFSLRGG